MAQVVDRLRVCPPHYQERLTQAGGSNRYGEPNFRLDWGEQYRVRRGGIWDSAEYYFKGYRDTLEDGRPCWVLRQWRAPECFGDSEMWFRDNYDPRSRLQLLGDFPWRGLYVAVQPLIWRGLVNGRMVVEHMPLSGMLLDIIVPLVIEWSNLEECRKRVALDELHARRERDHDLKIEAAHNNAKMAFRGPVSFSRQWCRTSLIDRRAKAIEENWSHAVEMLHREGLGITIH